MATPPCFMAPTDFSAAGDRAARRAASLAAQMRGELHLVHVLPPAEVLDRVLAGPGSMEPGTLRAHAEQRLGERASALAAELGVSAKRSVLQGRAHEEIARAAAASEATMVVVGTRGEHDRDLPVGLLGGTALKLATRSAVPLLLVRREMQEPYCNVVACAKRVIADCGVIAWADRLCPSELIHVLSVYSVPYQRRLMEWGASQATMDAYAEKERQDCAKRLSEIVDRLGLPAARVRFHIERGEPVGTILSHAARSRSDLIILGRYAGSEADEGPGVLRPVIFRATTDVLVVPQHAAHA